MTSEISKEERAKIIEKFRIGKLWVLISTDLMARGIDFKGISLVINYDMPTTMINYIHRVGRTGRAGRPGKAVTFFTNEDKPILRTLGNLLKASGCDVPSWILQLQPSSRQERKLMEKKPVERKGIGERESVDPDFKKEMAIRNKIYLKKLKKETSQLTE